MLLTTKNLEKELQYERNKFTKQVDILSAVEQVLKENEGIRLEIKNNLKEKSSTITNKFEFDLLDTDKIYHLQQIKSICVNNRLRFLNSSLFKSNIPEEAISKIHNLEKLHKTKLQGFKIVAPSKTFELKNYDDPLLFAPMGNDYFYLIHQWGSDLKWYRKLMFLPIKNIISFIVSCLVASALFTIVLPVNNLSKSIPLAPVIVFLFMFKSISCTIGYYFFMMGKNFNSEIWNREFKEN